MHFNIMSLCQEVSNCNLTALHKELIYVDLLDICLVYTWLQAVTGDTSLCPVHYQLFFTEY